VVATLGTQDPLDVAAQRMRRLASGAMVSRRSQAKDARVSPSCRGCAAEPELRDAGPDRWPRGRRRGSVVAAVDVGIININKYSAGA